MTESIWHEYRSLLSHFKLLRH